MAAIFAVERIAAAAWDPPVTGAFDIVEIGAARPLQQVSADGRSVAQLCGGARQQRLAHHRKRLGEGHVIGERGVAHHRTDAEAAIVQPFDLVEP